MMKVRYSFQGGVHPSEEKISRGASIEELEVPDRVIVPLSQHIGAPCEATVSPGLKTRLHRHNRSEEVYHFTKGNGEMILGEDKFDVREGDTVAIRPGVRHQVTNRGKTVLKILCCCAPPYSHNDTEMLDEP